MICYYPVRFETSDVNVNIVDAKVAKVSMQLGIYDNCATAQIHTLAPASHRCFEGRFEVNFSPTGTILKTNWAIEDLGRTGQFFGRVLMDAAIHFATSHAKEAWRGTNGDYADYRGEG